MCSFVVAPAVVVVVELAVWVVAILLCGLCHPSPMGGGSFVALSWSHSPHWPLSRTQQLRLSRGRWLARGRRYIVPHMFRRKS